LQVQSHLKEFWSYILLATGDFRKVPAIFRLMA
jgi:hypothetical protein